jgi:hypothetical protein
MRGCRVISVPLLWQFKGSGSDHIGQFSSRQGIECEREELAWPSLNLSARFGYYRGIDRLARDQWNRAGDHWMILGREQRSPKRYYGMHMGNDAKKNPKSVAHRPLEPVRVRKAHAFEQTLLDGERLLISLSIPPWNL